jgi:hypothetical protein
MKYDISTSDNNKYLRIFVNEAVTADLLNDFIGEAAKKSIEYEINKFLFDLRLSPNQADPSTHYNFVYNRSKELGFKPVSKHALLVNSTDINDYSFVETILLNAGYRGKMFTDESDAIQWLEQ